MRLHQQQLITAPEQNSTLETKILGKSVHKTEKSIHITSEVLRSIGGFSTALPRSILRALQSTLTVTREAVVDFELPRGDSSQTVESAGDAPPVNSTNATQASTQRGPHRQHHHHFTADSVWAEC